MNILCLENSIVILRETQRQTDRHRDRDRGTETEEQRQRQKQTDRDKQKLVTLFSAGFAIDVLLSWE